MTKTNAMRILDAEKAPYTYREYDPEITDGERVAEAVGVEKDRVFKTLVTQGNDLSYYVFVVPVNFSLDLKKAAVTAGVKRVEMIKQKDLFPLTGYVHGGCSSFGMKKKFFTVVCDTATLFDRICVSGGRKGLQIELSPSEIVRVTGGIFADII